MSTHHGAACFLFIYLFHFVDCSPFVFSSFLCFLACSVDLIFFSLHRTKRQIFEFILFQFYTVLCVLLQTQQQKRTEKKNERKKSPDYYSLFSCFFPFRSLFWFCFLLLAYIVHNDRSVYYCSFSFEGHSSVASTQREREQKFFMVNTSQHHQQQQQHQQQLSQQQPLQKLKTKRSSSGSSNGSNEKPPQLPPRDSSIYAHELPTVSIASRQVAGHSLWACTRTQRTNEHANAHTRREGEGNLYNRSWLIAQCARVLLRFIHRTLLDFSLVVTPSLLLLVFLFRKCEVENKTHFHFGCSTLYRSFVYSLRIDSGLIFFLSFCWLGFSLDHVLTFAFLAIANRHMKHEHSHSYSHHMFSIFIWHLWWTLAIMSIYCWRLCTYWTSTGNKQPQPAKPGRTCWNEDLCLKFWQINEWEAQHYNF